MFKRTSRFLVLLSISALVAGCKLATIVVEGGEVESYGQGFCVAGTICAVEVSDTNFFDIFSAQPYDGWYFHKWNSGDRFFCGNSTLPSCKLSFDQIAENEVIKDLVASSEVFYLMPVFKNYPRAIQVDGKPRVIKVDGKEWLWLEPVDFIDYSYNQVREVCPKRICSGALPGSTIDLTGYIWASSNDVGLLFQAYVAAGKAVSGDFAPTASESLIDYILYAMLSEPPHVSRPFPGNPEYTETNISVAAVSGDGVDSTSEVWDILRFPQEPNVASSISGAWFWRPID